MRILVGGLLLLISPVLGVIAFKCYQARQAEQASTPAFGSTRGEVLFFNASWCGPCRQMKPIVSKMRHQGYRMRDIDIDRNRALAHQYNVRAVPTFVFVENGSEVRRFSGGTSPENLRKLCASPTYR